MCRGLSALATLVAAAWLAPVVAGQTAKWTAPRTTDGQPDLQGYWTNATFIPLERSAEYAGRDILTEEEAIAYQKKQELRENSQAKDDIHYDNVLWQSEHYPKGTVDRRTSLIYE